MLPVRCDRRTREGGAARESKNEPEKKERSARGGMPEKNAETCFDKMERICLPLPGSPCQCRRAWRENEMAGILL
jgi:hypothetical protein